MIGVAVMVKDMICCTPTDPLRREFIIITSSATPIRKRLVWITILRTLQGNADSPPWSTKEIPWRNTYMAIPLEVAVYHISMGSPYDKWLRPRLNTQWQNIENQTFVDNTLLASIPVEKYEEDSGDEEEIDNEEISDSERSDSEEENEPVKDEDEDETRHDLPWRDGPRLGDYDIVTRFVTAMEDQDPLHPDSISRLEQFFKLATLENLEEASRDVKASRILLEDRNFSRKCFRPYPRSMTPKQLHEALARQVRRT